MTVLAGLRLVLAHAAIAWWVNPGSWVIFAVNDWSVERRFLGPFRGVFAEGSAP